MKKYIINIILLLLSIIIFFLLLISAEFGYLYIPILLFSLSIVINTKYIKKRHYKFTDLYKTIIFLILFVLEIIFLYLMLNTKSWDSIAYAVYYLIILATIIVTSLLNVIFRIYYLIKYEQKLNFKNNIIYNIIYLGIVILSILSYIIIIIS